MRNHRHGVLALCLALSGCPGRAVQDAGLADAAATPRAHWQLPRSGPNAFMLPWPSDLTRHDDGTIDLHYVPNAVHNAFVNAYSDSLDHRIDGFSPVASAFLRFSAAVDTSTLPAEPAATLDASASVQLIDVDPGSPEHGTRRPVAWTFRETQTRYWTPNTLAVAPAVGFPLRTHTRYALVVTRDVRPRAGGGFQRDVDLDATLATTGGDVSVTDARTRLGSAVREVEAAGVPRERVLTLAVFTTGDPTAELFRAMAAVHAFDAPSIVDIARTAENTSFVQYEGHYGPSPVFQSGPAPYWAVGTGDFALDATGAPVVQDRVNIAFALTVPPGTPPAAGWPIVIYAHGTGGDATSFVSDGTARSLAGQGLAVIGFDQLFNGERAVGGRSMTAIEFFNFANPSAMRTNNRQAALDLAQLGRLVRTMRIPASVALGGDDVRFDASRVMFFGHSQGGLNGPLWLAAENGASAAVLSGAGGTFAISLVQKTEPVNVPQVVAAVLGIPTSTIGAELSTFHPVVALAQTVYDPADPVNYGRYIVREPRPGNPPRHVYQTEGFVDSYAPDDGIESLAFAMGLPLLAPVPHPPALYPLLGLPVADAPQSLNIAGGTATGGWQQFDMAAGSDGHFVVFDLRVARDRAAMFLGSCAHDPGGAPTIR